MIRSANPSRGYSLLEMLMVLMIAGIIWSVAWALLPAVNQTRDRDTADAVLDEARLALLGFLLARHHLPCAYATQSGSPDCGLDVGFLPFRELGVAQSDVPIRYGVSRGAGLNQLQDRFRPRLPPLPRPFDGASALAEEALEPTPNRLDFCLALHDGMLATGHSLTAGAQRIPVAIGLAHPGNGGTARFDGLNEGSGFELADTPSRPDYDDITRTIGFAELSAELDCPARVASMDGASRAASTAYDLYRYAQLYYEYRRYAQVGADQLRLGAERGARSAELNLGVTVANTALGVFVAAATLSTPEPEPDPGALSKEALESIEKTATGLYQNGAIDLFGKAATALSTDGLVKGVDKALPAPKVEKALTDYKNAIGLGKSVVSGASNLGYAGFDVYLAETWAQETSKGEAAQSELLSAADEAAQEAYAAAMQARNAAILIHNGSVLP